MLYKSKIKYIYLISLGFLISSCQYNEDFNNIDQYEPPTKKETHQNDMHFVLNDGVYLIDLNWDHSKLDSVIHSNPNFIFLKNEKDLVFITNDNDSIPIYLDKISRTNPIIVFNKSDGPILTSLSRIHIYYKENSVKLKPKTSKSPIDLETNHQNKLNTKLINKQKIDKLENLNLLKSNKANLKDWHYSREFSKPIKSNQISQVYPRIPNNKKLIIYFDNDFWDYTDYYYTNGIKLGYVHPLFSNSLLSNILVSNARSGYDYYGIQIDQKMYTGLYTKVDSIIKGDRPWAAYMSIGQFLVSYDHSNKIKHESEFNIGIIGPKSGGGFLQDLVHTVLPNNSPPEGWENQIKTDVIIDYQYKINKLLYDSELFESYIKASAQVGTLRDNLKWGFGAKYGKFTSFYINDQSLNYNGKNKKLYYSLFADLETQLIGYDATLQGGVTDRTSIYVIPTKNMERFVIQSYIGMELTYKKIQLQFIQYWKSKEFKTGKDHKYVSVRLFIGF